MAVIWQKKLKGRHYQVRSAGHTRRLYTDGVFHTQYNPTQAVTGGVWDCLMLPALFYRPGTIKRVLVLGVGGGAAIKLLQDYIEPLQITGIELNPVHISVARRFFSIKQKNVQLVQADALEWIRQYRGPAFDMIIDDLFTEKNGEPLRVVRADSDWYNKLGKHLQHGGLVVSNFISTQEFRHSAWQMDESDKQKFTSVFQFSTPQNENRIVAFMQEKFNSADLRKKLLTIPLLEKALRQGKLNYNLRKLA